MIETKSITEIDFEVAEKAFYQCEEAYREADYQLAVERISKTISILHNAGYFYFIRALCFCKLNSYEDALFDLDVAIAKEPSDLIYRTAKAIILLEMDDYEGVLEQSLAIDEVIFMKFFENIS